MIRELPSSIRQIFTNKLSYGELEKKVDELYRDIAEKQKRERKLQEENDILKKENEVLRQPFDELEKKLRDALDEEAKTAIAFRKNTLSNIPKGGWD